MVGKILKNLISDEDLIKKMRNGDELAETELLSRYKDLVTKISRCYFIVDGDLEDLIQEGMIGLYKAIKRFNESKDASFKTFAVLCIKHQIQTAIKKSTSEKNKLLSSAISLQEFSGENDNENFLPVELVFSEMPDEKVSDKEQFLLLQQKIKESLSPLEYKVLTYYLQGYSYKEISQALNVNSKSIDNSLRRIRNKLRDKL